MRGKPLLRRVPTGYEVKQGEVWAQADDSAELYINLQSAGHATYATSFGNNTFTYQQLPATMMASYFPRNLQTVRLQIAGGNLANSNPSTNLAAVAAKFKLQLCPAGTRAPVLRPAQARVQGQAQAHPPFQVLGLPHEELCRKPLWLSFAGSLPTRLAGSPALGFPKPNCKSGTRQFRKPTARAPRSLWL